MVFLKKEAKCFKVLAAIGKRDLVEVGELPLQIEDEWIGYVDGDKEFDINVFDHYGELCFTVYPVDEDGHTITNGDSIVDDGSIEFVEDELYTSGEKTLWVITKRQAWEGHDGNLYDGGVALWKQDKGKEIVYISYGFSKDGLIKEFVK